MKIRGTTINTPLARHVVTDDSIVSRKPWSSKNTVDKLCPAFTESGAIVTCEPVEGYPLEVMTSEVSPKITRCGKNLLNMSRENLRQVSLIYESGVPSPMYLGVEMILPPGSYTLKATPNTTFTEEYIYGAICDLNGTRIEKWNPVAGTVTATKSVVLDDWRRVIIYEASQTSDNGGVNNFNFVFEKIAKFDIQIEVGSTATAFEPYCGDTFAVGETIPALDGINTIYADAGLLTVTGRANPVNIIEKLTNAILSLGGNV